MLGGEPEGREGCEGMIRNVQFVFRRPGSHERHDIMSFVFRKT